MRDNEVIVYLFLLVDHCNCLVYVMSSASVCTCIVANYIFGFWCVDSCLLLDEGTDLPRERETAVGYGMLDFESFWLDVTLLGRLCTEST